MKTWAGASGSSLRLLRAPEEDGHTKQMRLLLEWHSPECVGINNARFRVGLERAGVKEVHGILSWYIRTNKDNHQLSFKI